MSHRCASADAARWATGTVSTDRSRMSRRLAMRLAAGSDTGTCATRPLRTVADITANHDERCVGCT